MSTQVLEDKTSIATPKAPRKCVVLLSGGIDSAVLLYSLVGKYECYPLNIDYGQTHKKEVIAARNICDARDHNLLLRYKLLNLGVLRCLLPSSLTGVGEIPQGHYTEESMKSTVVVGRNLIFLAIAAGYAEGIGAEVVAYAAHSGDHYLYPDCRPEFVIDAHKVIRSSTDGKVSLLVPFLNMTKTDIITFGTEFTVPYHLTWSCYVGGETHCGVCSTCIERRKAFRLAKVYDPTKYMAEYLNKTP